MIFDLIVPFYNPQPGWEVKFLKHCQSLAYEEFNRNLSFINIIIVNDGSQRGFSDKEEIYLKNELPNFTLLSYPENKGKGYALRYGVQHSKTDYIIYSDFDFPFGHRAIKNMFHHLLNGADIVTSRRTHGNYFSNLPLKRRIASKGLAFFNKYILHLPVSDTQAGLKGFNRYGKALFLKTTTDRFLFDMEFILLAGQVKDIDIKELDVNLQEGTQMTNFSKKVLQQEINNLIRIVIRKKDVVRWKKYLI